MLPRNISLLGLIFYVQTWLLMMVPLHLKANRLVLRWNDRSGSNRAHHIVSILVIDQSCRWLNLILSLVEKLAGDAIWGHVFSAVAFGLLEGWEPHRYLLFIICRFLALQIRIILLMNRKFIILRFWDRGTLHLAHRISLLLFINICSEAWEILLFDIRVNFWDDILS